MKLSTIWTDFDEFLDLCLKTGTNDTRHKMKIYSTHFDENGFYQFDWNKLFDEIVFIFCHDKRVASKLNYSKEFLKDQQEKLGNKFKTFETIEGEKIKPNDVLIALFEKLKLTSRVTLNGEIQFWGSYNDSYKQSDSIYLTKTITTGNPVKVEIIGYSNRQTKDYFKVIHSNSEILLEYIDGEYQHSTNIQTDKKVNLAIKYPEIIHFINAKYYGIMLDNLSFANFEYLIKSYCETKNLRVPKLNGFTLNSKGESLYITSLKQCLEYFESANRENTNIIFTYKMYKFNIFEVKRKDDEEYMKRRTEEENEWGKLRSANGSRKGSGIFNIRNNGIN